MADESEVASKFDFTAHRESCIMGITEQRYISKELTHFVGRNLRDEIEDESQRLDEQYKLLLKIIQEKCISYSPHNPGQIPKGKKYNPKSSIGLSPGEKISDNKMVNPRMVCFCDIPLEDLGIHIRKYSPFGLSFKKSFLIERGANPVFYVAKNSAVHRTNRSEYFDKMVGLYLRSCGLTPEVITTKSADCFEIADFLLDLLGYIKFFDPDKSDGHEENFYMEREWRTYYNIHFGIEDIYRIIIPRSYAKKFRENVPTYFGQITFIEKDTD